MWIYAYILSMVKDRVRAGCWSHFFVRATAPSMDRDWRGSRPRSPRYHTAIGRARPDPEGGSEDLHPHPLTHEDYPHGRPPYYRASSSSPLIHEGYPTILPASSSSREYPHPGGSSSPTSSFHTGILFPHP
jgi:hypothetical protein